MKQSQKSEIRSRKSEVRSPTSDLRPLAFVLSAFCFPLCFGGCAAAPGKAGPGNPNQANVRATEVGSQKSDAGTPTSDLRPLPPSPLQKIALSEEHFFMAPFDAVRGLVQSVTASFGISPMGGMAGSITWKNWNPIPAAPPITVGGATQ